MKRPQCLRVRFLPFFSIGLLCVVFLLDFEIVAQSKSLVIAVEDDAAPLSRSDGSGYANEIVTEAFKAVVVDVDLRVGPYVRCKRMAVNGEVAACFSTSPSQEFDGLIELSAKPLFSLSSGYFYNTTKPPKAKQQENLPQKT